MGLFDFHDHVITKVFNPLQIKKDSIMEFYSGVLENTGIYRFKKIIEVSIGEKTFTRYLIFSKLENTEYIFEAFPMEGGQLEAYLYSMVDSIPFSEEFLMDVAGQLYITTPEGDEFRREFEPELEDRVEGVKGKIKVYDLESEKIERNSEITLWDYTRDEEDKSLYLYLEMTDDNGMFRVFKGEIIDNAFYKVYQGT